MVASPAQAAPIDLLTISDASNWAGGDLVFNVTYTGTAAESFDFSAVDVTTTSGTDYNATLASPYFGTGLNDHTIAFGASSTSVPSKATITVHTTADADTGDETFQLEAVTNGGTPATTVDGTGTIWAVDNTNNKIVLSGATTVPETAVGGVQKSVTITATDTNPQAHDVIIPVKTADYAGTDYYTDMATSAGGPNRDYTALPADATIVIPAYQTSGTTTVQLWDDTADEQDTQFFNVEQDTGRPTLGGAVLAGQDTVKIGIQDDDATPTVSVGDAMPAKEGSPLTFPVTLSNPSEKGVTVDLTAAGQARGSATAATLGYDPTHPADADFVWGTMGSATATVTVPRYAASTNVMMTTTTNPSAFEGPENVNVTLSNPTNATAGSSTSANGVITDVEAGQTLELSSQNGTPGAFNNAVRAFAEGNAGPVDQKIYLKFSGSPILPTTLNYTFVDGTATSGADYTGKAGSVTVPADGSVVSIPVTIIGDRIDEPDETFKLVLTDPNSIADPATIGEQTFTITDDDSAPSWTTQDVTVTEGNSGQTMAHIPVTLSGAAATDATFTAVVTPGSAVDTGSNAGDNDYDLPSNSTVTIKAGNTTGYLDVPINGDAVYERDESFTVQFTSNTVPGSLDTVDTSRVTIKNDDAMPTVTFGQISGSEGGTVQVTGTIVGASQYSYDLGFTVAGTGDHPATPGTDFTSPTNLATTTVTVPQGFTGALTDAPINFTPLQFQLANDAVDEATETFGVTFTEVTSPAKGFTAGTATVKIADDPLDMPPAVSIEDVSIGEGEKSVDIPVDLTFTSDNDATSTQQDVTVPYWTQDGAAIAGQDYKATKGTLTIPAGSMSGKINVPIIDDKLKENGEDFFVKLGAPGPAGATLGKSTSQVMIKDNDGNGGTTPPPTNGGPTIMAPAWVTGAVAVPITGKATAGDTVDLWGAAWSPANPKLVKIASTKADSSGNYKFSRWIGTGYRFQVAVGDSMSDVVKVGIKQAPVFVASSPSKGKLSVAVQGNPRGPKQSVIVQAWVGGKWVNTWKGMTGTDNMWKTTVSQKSKSSWTLRAFVQGDTTWGINGGYSAAKKVTIK